MNDISGDIIDAAYSVHKELGPGLLESAYKACLMYELDKRGMSVRSQVPLAVRYRRMKIDAGYRLDLIVEDRIIVELKAVDKILPVHEAQLLSYLKLSSKPLGLIINFHTTRIRDGIKRMINCPNFDVLH